MLRIDSSRLRTEYPSYSIVWSQIDEWARRNPSKSQLSLHVIKELFSGVPTDDLAKAFMILVENGQFKLVYRVVDPSTGTLVGKEYNKPTDIPEIIEGNFGQTLKREEAQVTPVFKGVMA